jgi:hypothetical protein
VTIALFVIFGLLAALCAHLSKSACKQDYNQGRRCTCSKKGGDHA